MPSQVQSAGACVKTSWARSSKRGQSPSATPAAIAEVECRGLEHGGGADVAADDADFRFIHIRGFAEVFDGGEHIEPLVQAVGDRRGIAIPLAAGIDEKHREAGVMEHFGQRQVR